MYKGSCARTEERTSPVFIIDRLDLFMGEREGLCMYHFQTSQIMYLYSEITRLHGLVNCMTFNSGIKRGVYY